MANVLDSIVSGLSAIAPTVANLVLPGSGPLVHSLMRAVTGDGPEADIEAVAAKISADPSLMLELQQSAMAHELEMAKIDAAKLSAVNATMQAEAKSEHWPQWSWRPYNGFLFGTAIVLIYFLLPALNKPVPSVPEWIWMGWAAILGVATWDRGKEKRIKAGESSGGMLDAAINAALRG